MNEIISKNEIRSDLPCADKMAFDTAAEAEATAVVTEHQRGIKLKWYCCGYCSLWHLSST